jgi:hypothetical protein
MTTQSIENATNGLKMRNGDALHRKCSKLNIEPKKVTKEKNNLSIGSSSSRGQYFQGTALGLSLEVPDSCKPSTLNAGFEMKSKASLAQPQLRGMPYVHQTSRRCHRTRIRTFNWMGGSLQVKL